MGAGQDTILGTESVTEALKTKVNDDMTELFLIKTEVENARDGLANLLAKQDSQDLLIAGLAPSGGSYTACTSSTRPAFDSIVHGHLIGETDTGNFYLGDKTGALGTAERWVVAPGNRYTTAGLPGAAYTILTGTKVYDTTLDTTKIYNGSSWVLQFATTQFTVSAGVVTIKQATTSVIGASETATDAEAGAGSVTDKNTTPSNLAVTCFKRVLAKTSAHTVVAVELLGNTIFTNKSAGAGIIFTLPAATVGLSAAFEVRTAQYLRCSANGTNTFNYGGGVGAAGGYIRSNVVGTSWLIECREANKWSISDRVGVIKYDE